MSAARPAGASRSCDDTYLLDVFLRQECDRDFAQRAMGAEIRLETQERMLADRQISRSVGDEDQSAKQREFGSEIAEQIDR